MTTIRIKFDPCNPDPLTNEQKKILAELAKMPDTEIDYSDIPELTNDFFKKAVRNPFFNADNYKPKKKQTTVRIDTDILDWLKATTGKTSYQQKLNKVLRHAMIADL